MVFCKALLNVRVIARVSVKATKKGVFLLGGGKWDFFFTFVDERRLASVSPSRLLARMNARL